MWAYTRRALQTGGCLPAGRRRLHAFISKELTFRSRSFFSVHAAHLASATSQCFFFRRRTTHHRLTDPPRMPAPPKSTRPRPARAAINNLGTDRRLSSKVRSPNLMVDQNAPHELRRDR